MILLVTNEDYPVIVLTLQRYKRFSGNPSEIRFLTPINICVNLINTFFLGWVGDYTFSSHRNPSNGDSPLFDTAKIRIYFGKCKCYPEFNIPLTFGLIAFFCLVSVFLLFGCSCNSLNSKRAGEKRKAPRICLCRVVNRCGLFSPPHSSIF